MCVCVCVCVCEDEHEAEDDDDNDEDDGMHGGVRRDSGRIEDNVAGGPTLRTKLRVMQSGKKGARMKSESSTLPNRAYTCCRCCH